MSARPDITRAEAVSRAYELLKEAEWIGADAGLVVAATCSQAMATQALAYLKLAESGMLAPGEWTTSDYPPNQ